MPVSLNQNSDLIRNVHLILSNVRSQYSNMDKIETESGLLETDGYGKGQDSGKSFASLQDHFIRHLQMLEI